MRMPAISSPSRSPTEAALDAYLAASEGAQFALAVRMLGGAATSELDAASQAAGRAYGLVRLLLALPQTLAQGRSAAAP